MLRTIIIDDEAHQRSAIRKMAGDHCPGLQLVAEADGVQSGLRAVREHRPDLLLLDIKLCDGTGFDLLDQLHPIDCKVIFITAYDQFAVRAFRFSALDYLLKPLDCDDLIQAVAKINAVAQDHFQLQLTSAREQFEKRGGLPRQLIVKTHDHIHLIPVNDILYCQSDSNYVTFFLVSKNNIVASANLKDYEEILSGSGFFRVHKSYLINLEHVRRVEKAQGGSVVLEGEIKIPVSIRKRLQLFEKFDRQSHT